MKCMLSRNLETDPTAVAWRLKVINCKKPCAKTPFLMNRETAELGFYNTKELLGVSVSTNPER